MDAQLLPSSARSRSRSPEDGPPRAVTHGTPSVDARESNVVIATPEESIPDAESQCPACLSTSKSLRHTCGKSRGRNKRHATPQDGARASRSSRMVPRLTQSTPEQPGIPMVQPRESATTFLGTLSIGDDALLPAQLVAHGLIMPPTAPPAPPSPIVAASTALAQSEGAVLPPEDMPTHRTAKRAGRGGGGGARG